jgi:hypothetical protein
MLLAAQMRASRDVSGRALLRRRRALSSTPFASIQSMLSSTTLVHSEQDDDRTKDSTNQRVLVIHPMALQSPSYKSHAMFTSRSYATGSTSWQLQTRTRNALQQSTFSGRQSDQYHVRPFFVHFQMASYSSEDSSSKQQRPLRTLGTTRVPTPSALPESESSLQKTTPKSLLRKGSDMILSALQSLMGFLVKLPGNTWFFIRNPDELRHRLAAIKKMVQDEIHHYWVGFKVCTYIL